MREGRSASRRTTRGSHLTTRGDARAGELVHGPRDTPDCERLERSLERLAGLEADGLRLLDLDRLARAGVATKARCALLHPERAEAHDRDLATLLEALLDAVEDGGDRAVRL